MTTDIQIFNYNGKNVRTVKKDGAPWFVLKDVCNTLNISNQRDVQERLDPDEVGRFDLPHPQNPEKTIEMVCVNESGLYNVILRSDKPEAKPFRRWVTSVVLPSIRKHGAYMTSVTIDKMIDSPEFGIQLLTALKEERDKRRALEEENEQQRQLIAEYQPIKQYVDTILSSNETLTVTQIAADYDISARKLNQILREEGIQHNVNGQWILYREHMEKGYTKSKTVSFVRYDGTPGTKLHTQWTQKGRLMIHELLTKHGIMAVMDRENAG